MDKLALSLPEAAQALGLNIKTVRALIESGKLRAINIGQGPDRRRFVISTEALRAFLDGQAE
jgi:excisionase family DNA binding protein